MKETPCAIKFKNEDAAFRFYLEFKNSVMFRTDGVLTLIFPSSPEKALKEEPETYRLLKTLEAEGVAREVTLVSARGEYQRPQRRSKEVLRRFAKERPRERAFFERLRIALGERPKSASAKKGASGGQ